MDLQLLKKQLVSKQVNPLYVFTGPEVAVMDVYIDKIAQTANAQIVRAESVESIFRKLRTSALTSKRTCYVIRDDKEYLKEEKVWNQLINGSKQKDAIIILVYSNIDKRGKFYKQHTDVLCLFEYLSEEVLCKYVYKLIPLSLTATKKLIEMCGKDYSRIMLECDKINHLSKHNKCTVEEAFNIAVKQRIIHAVAKDAIFDLVEAVCQRRKSAFALLEEVKHNGEHPLVLVGLLYTNFRAMLLVQAGEPDGTGICERTGLTPFQVKLAKQRMNCYETFELVNILKTVRDVEYKIKCGILEADMAADYLVLKVVEGR